MMRRILRGVLAVGVFAAGVAQTPASVSATAALEHGSLVVWILTPATQADKLRIVAQKNLRQIAASQTLPTTVQEQTAGSFGQSASDYGQNAGSYGTASANVGKNASDTGQTAGSYGTTAGSYGKSASEHGQNAGVYGQTAGSYGQTASTFGQSLSGAPLSPAQSQAALRSASVVDREREAWAAGFSNNVHVAFESLSLKTTVVVADELRDKLLGVAGTENYPDVVMAASLPEGWEGSGLSLSMLAPASFVEPDALASQQYGRPVPLRPAIMLRASHPAAARAFVVWLADSKCGVCKEPLFFDKGTQEPVRLAKSAFATVLQGSSLGTAADVDAAEFSAAKAQQVALMAGAAEVPGNLEFRVDAMASWGSERLVVVVLRGIGASDDAFGVVHGQVVMRLNDAGRWKVLQISLNSWNERLSVASSAHGEIPHVTAVSQAAPPDGDNRQLRAELWWDNPGDASLLVVEWQAKLGAWTDTRLQYVPDGGSRLQTRVVADFASRPGEYRWRVWSVGKGGAVAFSPWRRLNILP